MQFLDLTLAEAAANIALDEALLEAAESAPEPREVLRLWEPAAPLVVVGRSSHVAAEVHVENCRERGIPVIRRTSGGLSIVGGKGCLMYAVVLSYELRPALRSIDEAHREVLSTTIRALRPLVPELARRGTSDLVIGGRKVSGNSLRCKRRHLLYHGTLLYSFPLELIGDLLAEPPRAPDYRAGRPPAGFVAHLPASGIDLRAALATTWQAEEPMLEWPRALTEELTREKYSREEWNWRKC
jgi:lipoate-protein ligase A